ncbi:MAG: GAF domain-containing protein [Spirochaetota bacterium]
MRAKRKDVPKGRSRPTGNDGFPAFDNAMMAEMRESNRILAETGNALLHLDNASDVYRFVSKAVHDLLGQAITATTSLDVSTGNMCFVSVDGLPVAHEKLISLFGIDPTKTTKRVDEMTEQELRHYRTGKLERIEDGLFGLLAGYVPRAVCGIAEKVLNTAFVYTIGIVQGDTHLGALFILSPNDIASYKDVIERVVNKAAFVIQRKHAERELATAYRKLEAFWEISAGESADVKGICDHVLSSIVSLTGSTFGFYGFINSDESVMTIHSWSGEAMKGCSIVDKPMHFPIADAGVWGEAVRKRGIFIMNDYAGMHAAKRGLPAGHVLLTNLMVVPVFTHGRIVALAAVANRPSDYTESDAKNLKAFAEAIQTIIDRKRAEDALQSSEARYRSIFENMQDVYYEATLEGTITEVSPSVETFTRYHRSEVIGMSLYDVYAEPADRDATIALLLKNGSVSDHEVTLKDRDGRVIECSLSASVSFDENKKPKMISGTIRDISERKRTEAMLVQTDKLRSLGVLASGVAHEVNQPLMALSLAIDNMQGMYTSGKMDEDYFAKKIDSMRGYIVRVKSIIEQVRLFSRDQSAAGIVEFSIDEAIDNVLFMVETQYRSRGIRIVRDRGTVPSVRGNLFKFEQVIVNLIANAKDAIEKKAASDSGYTDRVIMVRSSSDNGTVLMSIRDNGSGMSSDEQKNIFTPFYTTKPTGAGTGLGLSITYGIVKAMGGDIMFDSAAGDHTEVSVSIPAAQ